MREMQVEVLSAPLLKERKTMLELICQTAVVIFSGTSMFLVARKDESRKWAFIAGMLSQPFYFITLYRHQQWGLLILWVFFTSQYIKGIYNYWFNKKTVCTLTED